MRGDLHTDMGHGITRQVEKRKAVFPARGYPRAMLAIPNSHPCERCSSRSFLALYALCRVAPVLMPKCSAVSAHE